MTTSIAQTRQQLSAIIEAAQVAPQIITRHNAPVAVLVSPEYFNACTPIVATANAYFYDRLQQLRALHGPSDDTGLEVNSKTKAAWQRKNPFVGK